MPSGSRPVNSAANHPTTSTKNAPMVTIVIHTRCGMARIRRNATVARPWGPDGPKPTSTPVGASTASAAATWSTTCSPSVAAYSVNRSPSHQRYSNRPVGS